MAVLNKKLKVRKNGVTEEITLYSTTQEVAPDYISAGGGYAKLGSISNPNASRIRVRKKNNTYAILLSTNKPPSRLLLFLSEDTYNGTFESKRYDRIYVLADMGGGVHKEYFINITPKILYHVEKMPGIIQIKNGKTERILNLHIETVRETRLTITEEVSGPSDYTI